MVDPLTGGLAVGGLAFVSGLSYIYGKMRSEDRDGCNGHHWGDPYRPDEEGVSSIERKRAGLPSSVVQNPKDHYKASVFGDSVVVKGKAIKKCQDCGEQEVVTQTIGTMPLEAFSDDVSGSESTNAADITHIGGHPSELRARLEAVPGVKAVEVYAEPFDHYSQ